MAETINYEPVDLGAPSSTDRFWASACHACGGFVWLALAGLVATIVIWLVKKDESPFVDRQGREALNFRMTMLIGYLLCIPLFFVCGIGALIGLILPVVEIIFAIVAAIKVSEGKPYRYPICIRML